MEDNNINEQQIKKKKSPVAWFKGLKKPTKIVLCSALAVGVVSAVVFPVLAATVWNSTVIKLDGNSGYYVSEVVNITKDKKYTFSADISKLRKQDGGCAIVMADEGSTTTQTYKFVNEVTIKSNKCTFTRVDDLEKETDQSHKYYFDTDEEDSNIVIGKGSFTGDEKILTCTFTAKITAKIGIGIMNE